MRLVRVLRKISIAIPVCLFLSSNFAYSDQRCGATERWAVKVGTDLTADKVDVTDITPISIANANRLRDVRSQIKHGDNDTRLDEERTVYRIEGTLRLYKNEADRDYHLVVSDDSLRYSPGGTARKPTGTSIIAEIPDPRCYMGKYGDLNRRSVWDKQLRAVREKFEARFPDNESVDEQVKVRVTVTGVAFFDRDHGQIGRAINGFEIHPILDIEFHDSDMQPMTLTIENRDRRNLLANSGFEEENKAWRMSAGVIDAAGYPDSSRGSGKATLGNLGISGTTFLAQTVSIPKNVTSAILSYRLRVKSEEATRLHVAKDTLAVQIRAPAGNWIKTVAHHSNLERGRRYRTHQIDVSEFRGRTIQIYFKSVEQGENATAFYLDDVEILVQ